MKKAFKCFVIVLFLIIPIQAGYAEDITRGIPKTTPVPMPEYDPENPCPNILANHITVCGTVETATINKTVVIDSTDPTNNTEYEKAHEPIEGATVAVYMGAQFAGFEDINKTGEVVGKIEGLYMYNTTSVHGKYILAIPKNSGVNKMAFLAFFCGNSLKDLYMIDTSKDIHLFPVSLSCAKKVTPSTENSIPAPPAVDYVIRETPTSCYPQSETGAPGINRQWLDDEGAGVNINLIKKQHDDTYVGAIVKEKWELGVLTSADFVTTSPTYYPKFTTAIPETSNEIARKDVEGFVHSSMAYSLQAVSSLNCGISGCYEIKAPRYFSDDDIRAKDTLTVIEKSEVAKCNAASLPVPQNCLGPGLGLASPGSWETSYKLQKNKQIYADTKIGQIAAPGRSKKGQTLLNIYEVIEGLIESLKSNPDMQEELTLTLNIFGIGANDPIENIGDDPEAILAKVDAAMANFNTIKTQTDGLISATNDIQGSISNIGTLFNNINILKGASLDSLIELLLNRDQRIQFINSLKEFKNGVISEIDKVITNVGSIVSSASTIGSTVMDTLKDYGLGETEVTLSGNSLKIYDAFVSIGNDIKQIQDNFNNARLAAVEYKTAINSFSTAVENFLANFTLTTLPKKADWETLGGEITTVISATTSYFNNTTNLAKDNLEALGNIAVTANDNFNVIKAFIEKMYNFIVYLYETIQGIIKGDKIIIATTTNEFFPYSALLNYEFGERQQNAFQNVPDSDSYRNEPYVSTVCIDSEDIRKSPSALQEYEGEYPFKTCYWVEFPAEDTYSVEKSLYTATANLIEDYVPVANFYAPYEIIGQEVDPANSKKAILNETVNLKKVGKGYWRLGIMNTLCTRGATDDTKDTFVYPSVAITGGNEIKY